MSFRVKLDCNYLIIYLFLNVKIFQIKQFYLVLKTLHTHPQPYLAIWGVTENSLKGKLIHKVK